MSPFWSTCPLCSTQSLQTDTGRMVLNPTLLFRGASCALPPWWSSTSRHPQSFTQVLVIAEVESRLLFCVSGVACLWNNSCEVATALKLMDKEELLSTRQCQACTLLCSKGLSYCWAGAAFEKIITFLLQRSDVMAGNRPVSKMRSSITVSRKRNKLKIKKKPLTAVSPHIFFWSGQCPICWWKD